jgi:hypothetical protein
MPDHAAWDQGRRHPGEGVIRPAQEERPRRAWICGHAPLQPARQTAKPGHKPRHSLTGPGAEARVRDTAVRGRGGGRPGRACRRTRVDGPISTDTNLRSRNLRPVRKAAKPGPPNPNPHRQGGRPVAGTRDHADWSQDGRAPRARMPPAPHRWNGWRGHEPTVTQPSARTIGTKPSPPAHAPTSRARVRGADVRSRSLEPGRRTLGGKDASGPS